MSIWSRRYRKQRRYIERLKQQPFYETHGCLVVDGTSVACIENAPWFKPYDPDFRLIFDSGLNEIGIVHEGLAKAERKARAIAIKLLQELAVVWSRRLAQEFLNIPAQAEQ